MPWPAHLLLRVHAWHRGADLEPHCTTSIPAFRVLATRNFGKVVLRWSGVIDLLSRDVVNSCSSGDAYDVWCGFGGVAADVGDRGILNRTEHYKRVGEILSSLMVCYLNALLGVYVLRFASRGPVFVLWLALYNKPWEGIYPYETRVTEGQLILTYSVLVPLKRQ